MFVKDPHTPEQLEALALSVYVSELGDRLNRLQQSNHHNQPEVLPADEDIIPRSPSPPPEYDRSGRRTNTRFQRTVRDLEVERTLAVHRALELVPNYAPPPNLSKLTRCTDKVFLPVREHPQINFIGLLLGPRGKNLRRMELEAGAKLSIRGRGSTKEGSRMSGQPNEEELHCLVSSTSQQSIQRARTLIQEVIDTAIKTPDDLNNFKRLQLRELAQLNGTLRDDENQVCGYCRKPNHKYVECPQRQELKAESTCNKCGEKGHYMAECTFQSQQEETAQAVHHSEDKSSTNTKDQTPENTVDNSVNQFMSSIAMLTPTSAPQPAPQSAPRSESKPDSDEQTELVSVLGAGPPGMQVSDEEDALPGPPPAWNPVSHKPESQPGQTQESEATLPQPPAWTPPT